MSKTKTLFTMALLVLLGLMGVAQAQIARIELLAQPEQAAREGGKNEKAGAVWLDIDLSGDLKGAVESFTLTYSSPLAAGLTVALEGGIDLSGAELDTAVLDHAKGTIKIIPEEPVDQDSSRAAIQIEGVRLDVSMASGAVTVTLSVERGDGIALLTGPDTRNVIGDILPGVLVEVGDDPSTVRTRGTGTPLPDTIVTLKPGFPGAWDEGGTAGAGMSLEFEVEGLPKDVKAIVTIEPLPVATTVDPVVMGAIAMSETTSLTGAADGDPQSLIITLGNAAGAVAEEPVPTSVILTLMLDTSADDVQLPLQEGEIQARVTIADVGTPDPDYFIDKFTPYMTIFEIRPAQCTMLFPLVTVFGQWETVISITNPGYGGETADGSLEFTFYRQAIEGMPPVTYTTGPGSPGSGLQMDGTLAAGGTYQAYIKDILAAADWGETFIGHVMVTADYTGCAGLGWVTDFEKVNQAYLAVVIDSDTGKEECK